MNDKTVGLMNKSIFSSVLCGEYELTCSQRTVKLLKGRDVRDRNPGMYFNLLLKPDINVHLENFNPDDLPLDSESLFPWSLLDLTPVKKHLQPKRAQVTLTTWTTTSCQPSQAAI